MHLKNSLVRWVSLNKSQPTIVMVGGGLQQVTAVKYLQLLGYRVLVVDKNDQAKCRSISNFFFNSDGQDHKSISDFIIKKKKRIKHPGHIYAYGTCRDCITCWFNHWVALCFGKSGYTLSKQRVIKKYLVEKWYKHSCWWLI